MAQETQVIDLGQDSISFEPAYSDVADNTTPSASHEPEVAHPDDIEQGNDDDAAETPTGGEDGENEAEETPGDEGDEQPDAGSDGDEETDKPDPVQKRINKITRQRYEAERRAAAAEQRAAEIEAQLRAIQEGNAPAGAGPKPTQDQFESWDQYVEALTDWKVGQRLSAQESAQRQREAERHRDESAIGIRERIETMTAKGVEKYPDFEAVTSKEDLQISPVMLEAMVESNRSHEIAYHLGKNPAKAARIAVMSPARQAAEIGKLEAVLSGATVKTKTTSTAPAPIRPAGSTAAVKKDPSQMTNAEYRKWRGLDRNGRRKA